MVLSIKQACNTSTPSQGGSLCRGDALRTQTCDSNVACPVNGNWTQWGSYSSCSTTCGAGIRTRIRYCNNTNNFNELCIGQALETAVCILSYIKYPEIISAKNFCSEESSVKTYR
ncbi:unnamed protein product [Rotaria sp. Silwood2]|nr:unnamed protein product [Rotaria sp. Silwood2]